jgi:hypothetical protein
MHEQVPVSPNDFWQRLETKLILAGILEASDAPVPGRCVHMVMASPRAEGY